jgi:hypothetical protein
MTDDPYISKNQISLAGEFAVLSRLALHGFDANMTLGNTKSVDILLSHPETGRMAKLEVKTHLNNRPYDSQDFGHVVGHWKLSKKNEDIIDKDLFYCFVAIRDDHHFDFYIVPSDRVAKFAREAHLYWLSRDSSRSDTDLRSFMLGERGREYPIDTPFAEDCHSRWDLLR